MGFLPSQSLTAKAAPLLAGFAIICSLSFTAALPRIAEAQTKPEPSCVATGMCTCVFSLGNINNDADDDWICTQVAANGATTTTYTNLGVTPGGGGATAVTQNTNGTISVKTTPPPAAETNPILAAFKTGAGIIIGAIAWIFLLIASFILWLAGGFFNWTVIRTVFEFGSYFGASEGLLLAWGILRDIANIGLLFGFIFMGIATILNTHSLDAYSARKALPRLIIFAILLNFSLFATQVVIDTANSLATVFADQAGQTCDASAGDQFGKGSTCSNEGIAGNILELAGISGIWGEISPLHVADHPEKQAMVFIGLTLFVLITAFVLIAGAIMLITRAVVLLLLMITSPIGFAGLAIPKLEGLAGQWWHALISQSFFAPVFILLILISVKMADGLANGTQGTGKSLGAALLQGDTFQNGPQLIVVFAIVIGLMIASLMVAKKMGAYAAGFATNAAGAVVMGGTFGLAARGSNLVAGGGARVGRAIVQNTGLRDNKYAKFVTKRVFTPLESANLDIRRTGVAAGIGAMVGTKAGLSPVEHATYKDVAHRVGEIASGEKGKQLEKEYQKQIGEKKLEKEAHDYNPTDPDTNLSPENQRLLATMNEKELASLHGIKEAVEGLARNLSPEQFESLMKGDSLSDGEKENLRNARFKHEADLVEDAKANPADAVKQKAAKDAVQKLSEKDLVQLSQSSRHSNLFGDAKFASMLKDEQADKVKDNQRILQSQRDLLNTERKKRFAPDNVEETLDHMNPETFAKLSGELLMTADVINAAKGSQLAAIDPKKLSPIQKQEIVRLINQRFADHPDDEGIEELITLINAKPDHAWRGYGVLPGMYD